MAFTAAVTSPATVRNPLESETPSPMAPLEPPNFEIGSPPRGGPMASAEGQFAKAVKLLENANQDLLKRLDIANEKIVELAMKNSALQTELNMRKQIEEMMVELAVERKKRNGMRSGSKTSRVEPPSHPLSHRLSTELRSPRRGRLQHRDSPLPAGAGRPRGRSSKRCRLRRRDSRVRGRLLVTWQNMSVSQT